MYRTKIFIIYALAALLSVAGVAHSDNKETIETIELTSPPIDFGDLNRLWTRLKKDVGAPLDFPPPPIVLDWEVPIFARMGFQYPSEEFPDYRMQISIAPRTIDMSNKEMVLWGIGHELAHYLFLLRENGYELTKKFFSDKRKHHCDPEFQRVTRGVADELWNMYHSSDLQNKMYDEVQMSCAKHPGQ